MKSRTVAIFLLQLLLVSALFSGSAWADDIYGTFYGPFEYEVTFRHMALDRHAVAQHLYSKNRVWSYGWNRETGELVFSNSSRKAINDSAGEALETALRAQGIPARFVKSANEGTNRIRRLAELFGLDYRDCAEPALVGGEGLKLSEISTIAEVRPRGNSFRVKAFPGGHQWEACPRCQSYLKPFGPYQPTDVGIDLSRPPGPPDPAIRSFVRQAGSRTKNALLEVGNKIKQVPGGRFVTLVGSGVLIDLAIRKSVYALGGNEGVAEFSSLVGGEVGVAAVEHFVFGAPWMEAFGTTAVARGSFQYAGAFKGTSAAGMGAVIAAGIHLNMLAYEVRRGIYARINEPGFNGFTPEERDAWMAHPSHGWQYFKDATSGYMRALGRTYGGMLGF